MNKDSRIQIAMGVGLLLFLFPIAIAQSCDRGDINVKKGQSSIITSAEDGVDVYVRPGSGFEGISLEVEGQDGAQHTAWFPAEKCFPASDEWLDLHAWTVEGEIPGSLIFGYWIGSCMRTCTNTVTLNPNNMNLTVIAYGASKWFKEKLPQGCNHRPVDHTDNLIQSNCKVKDGGTSQPDLTTTTTTAPTTTKAPITTGNHTTPATPIVIDNTSAQTSQLVKYIVGPIAGVLLAVAAVIALVVICQKKSDRTPLLLEL